MTSGFCSPSSPSGANEASDRYDEVWNGVYRIVAPRDNTHSEIASDLCAIFMNAIGWQGRGEVRLGVNISDRVDNWLYNIRIPSGCVMLPGGVAKNGGDFWFGGPDFVVEISAPDQDPHDKIDFYQSVGVRELFVIIRDPWKVELFQLRDGNLNLAQEAMTDGGEIRSEVIPFAFSLTGGEERPELVVINTETSESRRI